MLYQTNVTSEGLVALVRWYRVEYRWFPAGDLWTSLQLSAHVPYVMLP